MTSKNMEVARFVILLSGYREDLWLHLDTFLVNIGVNMQRKTTLDLSKRVMYSFNSVCWIHISLQCSVDSYPSSEKITILNGKARYEWNRVVAKGLC